MCDWKTALCMVALAISPQAANAGDAAHGKITFLRQCAACHTVLANTRDSMGPNLFGIAGRKAGSKPRYAYSEAMKNSGIVWNDASLKSFVMNPNAVVPASNMMFAGITSSTQADDVVAYLATLQ
jgi:cytochrome c